MRQKLTSNTYMREALDYEIVIINKEENDYTLSIKKLNKVTEPFILEVCGKSTTYLDNGYYVVEATPRNEYYNARVFLDEKKNIIEYYFDISKGNGLKDKVPYYDDLYLDVIYSPERDHYVRYDDMDELEEALEEEKITKEEYDRALEVGDKLTKEIKDKTNFFINIDFPKLIEKYFD